MAASTRQIEEKHEQLKLDVVPTKTKQPKGFMQSAQEGKLTKEEITKKFEQEIKKQKVNGVQKQLITAIAAYLEKNQEKIDEKIDHLVSSLKKIGQAAGKDALKAPSRGFVAGNLVFHNSNSVGEAFYNLFNIPEALEVFCRKPDIFVTIAQSAGESTGAAFGTLSAYLNFVDSEPQKIIDAFASISRIPGGYSVSSMVFQMLLFDEKTTQVFLEYCDGKTSLDNLLLNILSHENIAIEIGRPLDELHDNAKERTKYLNSLPKINVLALVLSNPEYFYTSSNNLLFDRLKELSNGKSVIETLQEYGLVGTEQHRNLLFRAINYGRFYGEYESVFTDEDAVKSLNVLLAPLKEKQGFDKTYFYLLANCLGGLDPGMKAAVLAELTRCKILALSQTNLGFQGAKERYAASSFLLDYLENLQEKRVNFDPSKYRDKDGKLLIVQVFSKQDTEKDHWILSQQWFSKYGKPKTGENGELIYETKNARIVLYMGEDEKANQNFVKGLLSKSTNMLLTFRGHSFSLEKNLPDDIFGNCNCHILFIPGSCGSAGSTPKYISKNPKTSLTFIANTSTGRGQVTNALIEIMMVEDLRIREGGKLRTYADMLNNRANSRIIKANGGDSATLTASSLGEQMLNYVYNGEK
ncbi:MAG: hypothetical protein NTX79_03590 [Candidatus Micrarchaeota archaeon]|nr:hypothetical protein [Candidatus Micrarchaeota archaeon]